MKNDFFLGDIYPNMGYMTTRANTIPEPADRSSMTNNDTTLAANHPLGVDNNALRGHYFSLIIVVGVILLLGVGSR
jgi:hypothetical protein